MVWHQWTLASGVNQFVFFLGLSQGHLLSEKGRQYHNNITRHQREEVKITKDGILIDKDDIARRPQFLKDSHFTFRYTHGFIHNYLWMKHLVCEPCTGQTLTDTAPCVRVTTARVLFILHHSSQRDKSLTVTPARGLSLVAVQLLRLLIGQQSHTWPLICWIIAWVECEPRWKTVSSFKVKFQQPPLNLLYEVLEHIPLQLSAFLILVFIELWWKYQ